MTDDLAPASPGGRNDAPEATVSPFAAQSVVGAGQTACVETGARATSAGACFCGHARRRVDRWLVEADVRWMVGAFGE